MLRFTGSSEAAILQLKKADAIRPNFVWRRKMVCCFFLVKENASDQVPVLNELVLASLNHATHQQSLGLVQAARLTLSSAREYAKRLAERGIHKPLVDVDLSLALLVGFDKGQQIELLSEARASASLEQSAAERDLDAAVCDFYLGADVKNAVDLLNSALHASCARSTAFNALLSAAAVFSKAKLDSSAHTCLVEATKLDDRSSKPLLALASLYMKAGRFDLAQKA